MTENIPIKTSYDQNLLSLRAFGFNAVNLLEIAEWLYEKINCSNLRMLPYTVGALKEKHKKVMDLYELAKTKEGESKNKTFIKAKEIFYRPRLPNLGDQRLFERLVGRVRISKHDRGHNKVSKI